MTETYERREARELLSIFTTAVDGTAVMDGAGMIWHKSGDAWFAKQRDGDVRRATPIVLARGLCPDLADELEAVAA